MSSSIDSMVRSGPPWMAWCYLDPFFCRSLVWCGLAWKYHNIIVTSLLESVQNILSMINQQSSIHSPIFSYSFPTAPNLQLFRFFTYTFQVPFTNNWLRMRVRCVALYQLQLLWIPLVISAALKYPPSARWPTTSVGAGAACGRSASTAPWGSRRWRRWRAACPRGCTRRLEEARPPRSTATGPRRHHATLEARAPCLQFLVLLQNKRDSG